ncbi:YncE family protein [Rhodococcoides yunnanense]|uniref:YncE family protein n=1 Tax=Rhodococcoides yunnanense TaxID=278209 RepID=UPI00352FF38D
MVDGGGDRRAGHAVYVANPTSGTVSVIDTATNAVESTVPAGKNPVLTTALDGTVYVTNAGPGTVSAVDSATDTATAYVINGDDTSVSMLNTAAQPCIGIMCTPSIRFDGFRRVGSDGRWLFGLPRQISCRRTSPRAAAVRCQPDTLVTRRSLKPSPIVAGCDAPQGRPTM